MKQLASPNTSRAEGWLRRGLTVALVAAALATGAPILVDLASSPVSADHIGDGGPLVGSWTTHANGDRINRFVPDGDVVWTATDGGGLVRWNQVDGTYMQYLAPQDGLPSNTVHDLAMADDGTLWLATDRGLAHFDPATSGVTSFTPDNTADMPARRVTALAITGDGKLWVGFGQEWDPDLENTRANPRGGGTVLGAFQPGGLALFDPATGAFDPANTFHAMFDGDPSGGRYETIPSENITRIATTSDGLAWFGTRPYYVWESNACQDDDCRQEDGYWVEVGGGLAATNGTTWRHWSKVEGASCYSNFITDLTADDQNRVWAGTLGQGLLVMRNGIGSSSCRGGSQAYFKRPRREEYDGLRGNTVWSVDIADDGRVWIATGDGSDEGLGVAVLEHGDTFHDPEQPWNSDDDWQFVDLDGVPGVSRDLVTDMSVSGPGPYIFGTRNNFVGDGSGLRVFRFDTGEWRSLQTAAEGGLPSNQINAIAIHPLTGESWVGTNGRGIARFDGERWQSWRPFVPGGQVASLLIDVLAGRTVLPVEFADLDTCRAAMGPTNTIVRLGDDPTRYRFRRCKEQAGIAIEVQPEVARLTRAGTAVLIEKRGPASDVVTDITFDIDGNPWISARKTIWESGASPGVQCRDYPDCWLDGGVSMFNGDEWELFRHPDDWDESKKQGLPDNDVQALALGPDNRIWMGTGNPRRAIGFGVAIYDRPTSSWSNFTKQLVGTQFAGDGIADLSYDPDSGQMWLAHHAAVTCVESGPFGGDCEDIRLGGGVSRFDGAAWAAWSKGHSPPASMEIFGESGGEFGAVAVDPGRGRVWAGGYQATSSTFHWHRGRGINAALNWCPLDCTAEAWQAEIWPEDGQVVAIELDGAGNLWVGTHRSGNGIIPALAGVKLLDADGEWFTYTPDNSALVSNEITAFAPADDDGMWVGTRTKGISVYSAAVVPTPTVEVVPTDTTTPEATPTSPGPSATTPTPGLDTPTPTLTWTPPATVETATPTVTLGPGDWPPIYMPFAFQFSTRPQPTRPPRSPTPRPSATPRLPTATATATDVPPTATEPATEPATSTATPDVPPTATRTPGPTATPTDTATATASATPTTSAPPTLPPIKEWEVYEGSGVNQQTNLHAVHGIDADHVWMVGDSGTVLFWDGVEMWSQDTPAGNRVLRQIQMLSTTDGFIAADEGFVARYNGRVWRSQNLPLSDDWGAVGAFNGPEGVWAWVLGSGSGHRVFYDGSAWDVNPEDRATRHQYSDVALVSANHAYASRSDTTGARIYEWDGTRWSPGANTGVLHDLHVLSATQGIGVGRNGSVWRLDGDGEWGSSSRPSTSGNDLFAVHMVADDLIWAGGGRTGMYLWNGERWVAQSIRNGRVRDINSIWVSPDGTAGWAVGNSGLILQYK